MGTSTMTCTSEQLLFKISLTIKNTNSKSYTIGNLWLYASTERIITHGLPPYTMQTNIGLHGFRGLVLNYITVPVSGNISEWHRQTTVTWPSQSLCRLGHYFGSILVYMTYGLGSTPGLTYRDSEKCPLNLHFWVLHTDRQVGSHAETVGQHHRDRKDPCQWDRSLVNVMDLTTEQYINLEEENNCLWYTWKDIANTDMVIWGWCGRCSACKGGQ
jgi:hypothetical protein